MKILDVVQHDSSQRPKMTSALPGRDSGLQADDWQRIDENFQQLEAHWKELVSENLDLALYWPSGKPISEPYDLGIEGENRISVSHDGKTVYVSSQESPWIVGLRTERQTGMLREFTRIRLGLAQGGVSMVATGGVWVFASSELSNRVVVLRLCHDWYQDRTRLIVMRVIDGGQGPREMAVSSDGNVVAIQYCGEQLVRLYQCRINGRLEPSMTYPVTSGGIQMIIAEAEKQLLVSSAVGVRRFELESIFSIS